MNRIKDILKRHWAIIALVVISAVVYHRWLSFGIFSFADYGFRFPETLKDYFTVSLWRSNSMLGYPNLTVWMLLFDALPGIFGRFGFASNVADKFFIFWPFVFATPLASFFLARRILRNDVAAFVSALVYSFNTYFLAINTQGHFSLSVAGAFAPLVILFFMKSVEESRIAFSVVSALLLFIVGSYDFRVAYVIAAVIFLYFLFSIIMERSKEYLKKSTASFSVFVFLALLLNLYWMLSFAKMGPSSDIEVLSRSIIDFSLNLPRAMTLFHPFWTGSVPTWFDAQNIPFYFWLIPVFAVLGFWLGRKNKNVIFFGLISLFGIILTKQTADPFGNLYLWLHAHLPGFGAFREASKFFILIAMGYSILIGSFVTWIVSNWVEGKTKIWGKYGMIILVSGLFLWNAQSIVTGKMGTIFVPRNPSQDDLKLRKLVNGQDDFYRTLWVPLVSNFPSYSNVHPMMNAIDLEKGSWESFSENLGQGGDDDRGQRIVDTFNLPYSKNLLSLSSVRYVMIDNKKEFYVDSLKDIPYLKKTDAGVKNFTVLENQDYRPHIYATAERETIHKDIPFQKLDYVQISPVKYSVVLKNAKDPLFLNFSEAYHPNWKLGLGNDFLSDSDHFQNDAKLNSYHVDPQKICASGGCVKNSDGTFDINLTLYFSPQAYLDSGLIVMVATLFGSLAFLAYELKKRHNE